MTGYGRKFDKNVTMCFGFNNKNYLLKNMTKYGKKLKS